MQKTHISSVEQFFSEDQDLVSPVANTTGYCADERRKFAPRGPATTGSDVVCAHSISLAWVAASGPFVAFAQRTVNGNSGCGAFHGPDCKQTPWSSKDGVQRPHGPQRPWQKVLARDISAAKVAFP